MPLDRIQAMLASQGVYVALVNLVERAMGLADAVDGWGTPRRPHSLKLCTSNRVLSLLVLLRGRCWAPGQNRRRVGQRVTQGSEQ